MTLTAYGEGDFGTPSGNPTVSIYRSNFDSWTRGGTGFPTTYNELLISNDAGPFPSTAGTPYQWNLNVSAVNWPTDLVDKTLTLVMVDNAPGSFTYWFGSGGSSDPTGTFAPTLTITLASSAVTSVPTMTEWGMIIFMVFAALGSVYYLRRQRRA